MAWGVWQGSEYASEHDAFLFHCMKTVCVGSYSGPYFPSFGLNIERWGVSRYIQIYFIVVVDKEFSVVAYCNMFNLLFSETLHHLLQNK